MKVGVIALSNGLGELFPHMVKLGTDNIKKYGNLDSKVYETAKMPYQKVWDNPKLRAEELNKALYDDEILYIHALIGGFDSVRILDYIDLNAPDKKIVGFSDATSYLTYLAQHNKNVVYGASILAGMAQAEHLGKEFIQNYKDVVLGDKEVIYPIYDFYVDGYRDWNDSDNNGELLERNKTTGPIVLNGSGVVSGNLWGGCMETLEQLKQTKYYPSEEFTTDRILFFETSESKPTPEMVRLMLYNYCMQGIFDKNKAVMFGAFKDYTKEETERVYKYITEIIVDEYKCDIPIIVNCPIGHTSPTWFLPYNEEFEIDMDNLNFTLRR